ncbi:DNA polymerase III subunit delta' [Jannaschia aquimarina]|uniref:DnaX protein n=1 Tax=Jannaschia aquimarina TaxID=935700 RepID=A0A0D1EL86_9RHOB|nr:DNA polymerase III subunit delta' [Jannaschia aquimarina]KIT17736.1 DNA polymerase III subunit tau [Jannaschia aquimarina]SNS96635.1 DNA polymerase-3 subunit delta' [Jannaschia aquimarina]
MTDGLPEGDRAGDAPHPRHTARLIGQGPAERAFLDAWNGGRPHHGWLLTGPRGVGKATLAWRIARFLLTDPPPHADSLDPEPGHPALPRIDALSEPALMLLRRPWDEKTKRLRAEITVDEARRLGPFFGLSASGRRVVIVDAADDLNRNAANAILKLLEEPPVGATLLLISHQPARLLPTIRSRCRVLRLGPLSPKEVAEAVAQAGGAETDPGLAELAQGSPGAALDLAEGGAETYAGLVSLFAHAPMDRGAARRLADSHAGRAASDRLPVTRDMLQRLLHRAARAAVAGPPPEAVPGEAATLSRLAPNEDAARALAALAQDLSDRFAHAAAVNVDPAAIVWDQLAAIDGHARNV